MLWRLIHGEVRGLRCIRARISDLARRGMGGQCWRIALFVAICCLFAGCGAHRRVSASIDANLRDFGVKADTPFKTQVVSLLNLAHRGRTYRDVMEEANRVGADSYVVLEYDHIHAGFGEGAFEDFSGLRESQIQSTMIVVFCKAGRLGLITNLKRTPTVIPVEDIEGVESMDSMQGIQMAQWVAPSGNDVSHFLTVRSRLESMLQVQSGFELSGEANTSYDGATIACLSVVSGRGCYSMAGVNNLNLLSLSAKGNEISRRTYMLLEVCQMIREGMTTGNAQGD